MSGPMDIARAAKLMAAIEAVRAEATRQSHEHIHAATVAGMEAIAVELRRLVRGKLGRSVLAREAAIRIAAAAVRYVAECTDYSPPIGFGGDS